ncbi:YdcF family protein [Mesobaculum littorinae]|uniref:YdcF family protein n=1 Tax=Mesobaculum littorinae TaxID=2486419 RepID=UPI0013E3C72E|nr:YdcF family protein [Mesobaculum littorinae]
MTRALRRLAILIFVIWALPAATAAYFATLWTPPAIPEDLGAVVVLSAGVPPDGRILGQTKARTETGVALVAAVAEGAAAPAIIFSGGRGGMDPAAKGTLMLDHARAMGLSTDRARAETGSHSTLQNALLSAPLLPRDGRPVAIVTHRYHLPRSWASFRWAGVRPLVLVPADPAGAPVEWRDIAMEGIKLPVNAARALLFDVLEALGLSVDATLPLLD